MAIGNIHGVTTIRRGNIAGHRACGDPCLRPRLAATQVFTIGAGQAIFGVSEVTNALVQGIGWVINLAIAERAIRRVQVAAPPQHI